MSLEFEIGQKTKAFAFGFAPDLRAILERIIRKYRQRMLAEVQSEFRDRVSKIISSVDSEAAAKGFSEKVNKILNDYHSNIASDMVEEIISAGNEYASEFSSSAEAKVIFDEIKKEVLNRNLTEAEVSRYLSHTKEKLSENLRDRVDSLLDDARELLQAEMKSVVEEVKKTIQM